MKVRDQCREYSSQMMTQNLKKKKQKRQWKKHCEERVCCNTYHYHKCWYTLINLPQLVSLHNVSVHIYYHIFDIRRVNAPVRYHQEV